MGLDICPTVAACVSAGLRNHALVLNRNRAPSIGGAARKASVSSVALPGLSATVRTACTVRRADSNWTASAKPAKQAASTAVPGPVTVRVDGIR